MRNSTDYKLGGTKTFRRASKKILGLNGGNLQNIKKDMRAIYVPDGYSHVLKEKCLFYLKTGDYSVFTEEELSTLRIFLQVDQSGAEALIVAYDSGNGDYRKLFINNVKPHVYVALKLFAEIWPSKAREHSLVISKEDIDELNNTPIERLKFHPMWKQLDGLIKDSDNWKLEERYYYLAKQTCHSANYGIQDDKFRLNILEKSGGKIVISTEDSRKFLNIYRALFPEIPESNRRIKEQIDRHHIIYNTLGFPYLVSKYELTDNDYKEYYAWPRQSTVAEITRMAFTELQEYVEDTKSNFDVLADTHDSYLVQCPLTEVIECKELMQKFMNKKLTSPFDGTEFYMKSECQIGFNWSVKKSEDVNPLGLQQPDWL